MQSATLGGCQIIADVITRPRGSNVMGVPLYTVMWGHSGKDAQIILLIFKPI